LFELVVILLFFSVSFGAVLPPSLLHALACVKIK
jgi:hypothetical protein